MPLKFNGAWRFKPPEDGVFVNRSIPDGLVSEIIDLIMKVATQGEHQAVLEHFKGYFCRACGATHTWSSSASWAETDLWSYAREAAQNAPLFIEAIFDACRTFGAGDPDVFAPDVDMLNALLTKYRIGYEVRPPRLVARETAVSPLVAVEEPPPTLAERAVNVLQTSLSRSEELLAQGRGREAVQESLWLLETVATAFRGIDAGGGTVEGKYFNQIVKDLRQARRGTTLDRVLDWMTALHGYLSSPSGGGVRHGLDLDEGIEIGPSEARLFCNLVRSYLGFLLSCWWNTSGCRDADSTARGLTALRCATRTSKQPIRRVRCLGRSASCLVEGRTHSRAC